MNDGLKIFLVFGIIGGAGFLAYKLLRKKNTTETKAIETTKSNPKRTLLSLNGKERIEVLPKEIKPFDKTILNDYNIIIYNGNTFLVKNEDAGKVTISGSKIEVCSPSNVNAKITIKINDDDLRFDKIQKVGIVALIYKKKVVVSAKLILYKDDIMWDITEALQRNEIK